MQPAWPPASKSRSPLSRGEGYFSERTIVALATPPGGALTVIRISGALAHEIARGVTGLTVTPKDARRARRCSIRDSSGRSIDDGLILPFFSPKSYTGEDLVEFFLHGSPMVAERTLEQCVKAGARMALPGEFSFRAVRNGKMTLSQAEAVRDLIAADNDFSLELALEKLSGSQHVLIEGLQRDLLQLCTLSEVGIDFSDQDIDEVSLPRLKTRLSSIASELKALQGSFARGQRLGGGVPVAIFGLPNAGKSSFFNALLGEDRSIVSSVEGTTRDVVREKLHLKASTGQVTLRVSDTAGLRESTDEVEALGMKRSLLAARDADLLVVVIDGLRPELERVTDYLKSIDLRSENDKRDVRVVMSKADLLRPDERERSLKAMGERFQAWTSSPPRGVSSVTLEGIHEVALDLAELAAERVRRVPGEVVLTRLEHNQAVAVALECLDRARAAHDLALFATDVRHGMAALGPLIGETVTDDILGKIFSDFCIGK